MDPGLVIAAGGVDPFRDGLVVHRQHASDLAQMHSFKIEFDRLLPQGSGITVSSVLRHIESFTILALISLVSVRGSSSFGLAMPAATERTIRVHYGHTDLI